MFALNRLFFFFFLDYRGFYVCLGRDGKVYDGSKFGWLEGRQVSRETAHVRQFDFLSDETRFSKIFVRTSLLHRPWEACVNTKTDIKELFGHP